MTPPPGVYAEIETDPTEFGGRRRFKNRGLRFGRQIGAACRASPEQYEPRSETPAMAPASGSFGGQLQSGAAAHAFVSIVRVLLANGDLESRLRKYQQSFEKRKPNRCCKMATPPPVSLLKQFINKRIFLLMGSRVNLWGHEKR